MNPRFETSIKIKTDDEPIRLALNFWCWLLQRYSIYKSSMMATTASLKADSSCSIGFESFFVARKLLCRVRQSLSLVFPCSRFSLFLVTCKHPPNLCTSIPNEFAPILSGKVWENVWVLLYFSRSESDRTLKAIFLYYSIQISLLQFLFLCKKNVFTVYISKRFKVKLTCHV